MNKGLSICISTYNRAHLLDRTLRGIARINVPENVDVELLVINNNCTDNTSAVVSEFGAKAPWPVREISEPQAGVNYGRNRAIQNAQYEHIVLFDDDIEPAQNWIADYFEAVSELHADCVVGPVNPKYEIPLPSYMTPVIIDSITSAYSQKGDTMKRLSPDVAHEMPGCNMAFTRSVAEELKGFNVDLGRVGLGLESGDDTDFGYRLVAGGKRVVYQPKCSIQHFITKEKLSKSYLRRRWRGDGVTQRIFDERKTKTLSFSRRLRAMTGIAKLWLKTFIYQIQRKPAQAFEYELRALRALGYLTKKH